MKSVLIFGNSGSGKSTLASTLCRAHGLAHMDLDSIAWLPSTPPERAPLDASKTEIEAFVEANDGWVIEGCYTDLLEMARPHAEEVIFLNLPVDLCIENARNRPWEPHKYGSKAAQDRNLAMLIDWISEYSSRDGVMSHRAHKAFYEQFTGRKTEIRSNRELLP